MSPRTSLAIFSSLASVYRIAKGEFKLNGQKIKLPALNNAPAGIGCNLHGGARGWNAYVWGAKPFVNGTDVGVVFTHTSPDGDEGFPGKVEVKVTQNSFNKKK